MYYATAAVRTGQRAALTARAPPHSSLTLLLLPLQAAGMAMGFPFTPFPMMWGLFGPGGGAAGADAAKAVTTTTPMNPFMPFGGRGMVPEASKDVMEGWTKWYWQALWWFHLTAFWSLYWQGVGYFWMYWMSVGYPKYIEGLKKVRLETPPALPPTAHAPAHPSRPSSSRYSTRRRGRPRTPSCPPRRSRR